MVSLPHSRLHSEVIQALVTSDARTATKYLSDKLVVRATRRLYGKTYRPSKGQLEILLTEGRPNYRERDFIRRCKTAGEPFPVRKVQLKFPPASKAKRGNR